MRVVTLGGRGDGTVLSEGVGVPAPPHGRLAPQLALAALALSRRRPGGESSSGGGGVEQEIVSWPLGVSRTVSQAVVAMSARERVVVMVVVVVLV